MKINKQPPLTTVDGKIIFIPKFVVDFLLCLDKLKHYKERKAQKLREQMLLAELSITTDTQRVADIFFSETPNSKVYVRAFTRKWELDRLINDD